MSIELERRLRSLRLSGMAESLPARLLQAEQGDLPHREFLELLTEDELEVRRDRLFARRLKRAKLPQVKSLADFDFSFNPKIPKRLVLVLATARFVRERRDLLLIGPRAWARATSPSRWRSRPLAAATPRCTCPPSTWWGTCGRPRRLGRGTSSYPASPPSIYCCWRIWG